MGLGQKGQKDGKILQPQISDFDELINILGYPVCFSYSIFLFPLSGSESHIINMPFPLNLKLFKRGCFAAYTNDT